MNEIAALYAGIPMLGAFFGAMALIFATRMASKN